MLGRLGRSAARHHWWFLALWLLLAITLGTVSNRAGGRPIDDFTIPGTEAQRAIDLLEQQFPAATGTSATVVFRTPTGKVTDAPNEQAIDQVLANLQALPNVAPIENPLTNPIFAGNISPDGTILYTSVQFTVPADQVDSDVVDQLEQAAQPAPAAGIEVEFGGAVVDIYNAPRSAISDHADDVGLALAVIILLISLGSGVAMLLPIGTALFSLGVATSLIVILERSFEIGSIGPILGTMLCLGVGIDYSLFVVSRYRQNLAEGMDTDDAVGKALATAGSAVLFAGLTVCLAMVALGVMGIPYVRTLGLTAALFVLVTMGAALTFLPAMIGLLGRRVDSLRLPWHHRTQELPADQLSRTLSARWAHEIARRPWLFAPVSLVVLLMLTVPLLRIDLGFPTDASAPAGTTQRKAYDLITEGFGEGANGPLLLVGPLPPNASSEPQQTLTLVEGFVQKLGAIPDVARVIPGSNPPDYTILFIEVVPRSGPNAPETKQLVENLRAQMPQALQGTGIDPDQVYIGGTTAELIDLTNRITERMPYLFAVVLGGSFLLLMMVFRSLFVPFKAAVMNLLSIGAAYGVLVAVFEWGWGRGAIGLEETVIIAAFVPVMMFAILFGLSMDYEVFLLSRIREEYLRSGDSHTSVVIGLANTARVITSAALIMIAVFLSFVTNPDPTVKMIGLGLAVAVLVDATIVRMVLVPSTMELMGRANWWLPRWLDRILPDIHLDEGRAATTDGARGPGGGDEEPEPDAPVPTPV
ncbi:MMPL family transporter [Rhabdothermincola sediminis]|uniref:MMPL family transporter n=1 Tax=Rhabdothermincola sediminis TaxID=2751370 RepID=UPI001AA0797B|nr:MMPL family transporter [Rhabdothermincola sediminis]